MLEMLVGFTEQKDKYIGADITSMTPEEVASVQLSYVLGHQIDPKLFVGWFEKLNNDWLFKVNDLCNFVAKNWRDL